MGQPADTVLVGDDVGVLRCIRRPQDKTWNESSVLCQNGDMDKDRGIVSMSQACCLGGDTAFVAVGRRNGTTSIHNADSCIQVASFGTKNHRGDGVASVAWQESSEGGLIEAQECGSIQRHSPTAAVSAWDQWEGREVFKCSSGVQCTALHSDGVQLALGCAGAELAVLDLSSGARSPHAATLPIWHVGCSLFDLWCALSSCG